MVVIAQLGNPLFGMTHGLEVSLGCTPLAFQGIRARLAEPEGWITLFNTENGRRKGWTLWEQSLGLTTRGQTMSNTNKHKDIYIFIHKPFLRIDTVTSNATKLFKHLSQELNFE